MRRRTSHRRCSRKSGCCRASRPPRRRCCASFWPVSRSSTTSSMHPSSSSWRSASGCAFICRHSRCSDMRAYILHRLEVAGSQGREIFDQRHFRYHLPLHRWRAAADQHVVRYRDAGRHPMTAATWSRSHDVRAAINELQWMEIRLSHRHAADAPAGEGVAPAAEGHRLGRRTGRGTRPMHAFCWPLAARPSARIRCLRVV